MKISILLPYKEDYTPKHAGAVSIHVSNLLNFSKFSKTTKIFGNTKRNKYLTNRYVNIKIKEKIFTSSNKKYVQKFINLNKTCLPDLVEVHNRPSYIQMIKEKLSTKIVLYFHNNPLTLLGSKSKKDRLKLLNSCDFIFFNSKWTKDKFFSDFDEKSYLSKFAICYQSTKKQDVKLNDKRNIITFVGKLNSSKGYDLFGEAILKILNKYPNWKSIVVGDEPRESHNFFHKNLKIFNFKENKFVLDLLKKTSIFVACPRWEEPFGRSSLEASSLGCAVILAKSGGLLETTKHPIVIKKLDVNEIFRTIEEYILKKTKRIKFQKLNYKHFFLTHEYVSKIIDTVRANLYEGDDIRLFNINRNSKLKIIHITNFNHRFYGRLQYNTGVRINNGLIKNGHNVLSLSDRDLVSYAKRLIDPYGEIYLNKLIRKTIDNFRPDLILLGHADKVNNEMLLNAKEKFPRMKISQWFLDPLSKNGPDYEKNKIRLTEKSEICDANFITTSPDVLDFKQKNLFFIPNPCDKSLDNLKNFTQDKKFDIFFAISHGVHRGLLRPGKFDSRENFIINLKKICKDVKFDTYGMFGKQPVWGNDFIKKLSNSRMALNLSRGKPVKYYSSDRIAQLMGNGLLTFIHRDTKYSDFFSNKEMIFYDDINDLSEKIKKYSKDKKMASKIAKKGHSKYHEFFNSKIVVDFIISKTFDIKSNKKYLWFNN